jgi:hypothetical protein
LEWGYVSAIDFNGRTIWIVDAYGYGKRFVVRSDEKLTNYFTAPLEAGDAYIPLGMSQSDWELFINTLKVWKPRM